VAATGVEGTGLGLSIVRETVESLGGRAWAEFTDTATTFAFSLPVRRASELSRVAADVGVEARG
jgi:signal transduction histidine kinase